MKDEAHEAATISSGVLYPTNSGWFMVIISSLSLSFICEANTNLPSQPSFIYTANYIFNITTGSQQLAKGEGVYVNE